MAIARALIMRRKLMIADEIAFCLDVPSAADLLQPNDEATRRLVGARLL